MILLVTRATTRITRLLRGFYQVGRFGFRGSMRFVRVPSRYVYTGANFFLLFLFLSVEEGATLPTPLWIWPTFVTPGKTVIFFGVKRVAPSSTLKKRKSEEQKISTCIHIHTRVYANTWWWGPICPLPPKSNRVNSTDRPRGKNL